MFTFSGEIRLCATPHRRLSLLRVSRVNTDFHRFLGELPIRKACHLDSQTSQLVFFHMCVFALTNGYAERLIGTLRRECLAHIIILNEFSLKRILKTYLQKYERSGTHLSLEKDALVRRAVQLPELGRVIELLQVGVIFRRCGRCLADTRIESNSKSLLRCSVMPQRLEKGCFINSVRRRKRGRISTLSN